MTSSIYRKTLIGDTESGLGPTEKIRFNAGTVPDSTGKLVSTGFRMNRDVSFHPNPRRVLDQIQDNLLGRLEVSVAGYFKDHDATLGPRNLYDWQVGTGVNNAMPFGRFGLLLDDFANNKLDINPTATLGYILFDIEVKDNETPRDQVDFIARFYLNGTIV